MLGVLKIIGKLLRQREIKNGFKRNKYICMQKNTLQDYSILRYKTGSTVQESADIHLTMLNIVDKYDIKIIFDGKLHKRELNHFDLTDLSEGAKRQCHKFFSAIENSLPTNMVYYKDCYLIVLEENAIEIKELFQKVNYPIEDVEMEDFKKYMNKVNDHENFYQTIVTAK